ncbi:MAG: hypothetical protein FJ225_09510 [Lentisphaerae bacterium]|nr:hypothetical protein [Lentisphaerota bacterium]
MSARRMVAVGFIFLLACAGWWILGAATTVRSTEFSRRLGAQVERLWGTPLVQEAPALAVQIPGSEQVRWLMPSRNDIKVELRADYRKKGLIWYPTYTCSFDGTYTIANAEDVAQKVRLHFKFPAEEATYDGFAAAVDGQALLAPVDTREGIGEIVELAPGESREFRVAYRTRGLRDWRYRMDPHVGRVRNLNLVARTDFKAIDYTEGSLSPMSAEQAADGMTLAWNASDLITREDIGVVIPERLNPGPLTSRITYFAPVCLVFFFILVATIAVLYGIDIHPMHYLFVAAGFFAFHLLLSYMVGLVNIHVAFVVAAVVSVTLVTSYLAAALRGRLPWKVAVAGQVFFLVLFSYSFFLKGVTGLTVAIGSVVTLAVLMKVTARVDWNEVFARAGRGARPAPTPPPLPAVPAAKAGPDGML